MSRTADRVRGLLWGLAGDDGRRRAARAQAAQTHLASSDDGTQSQPVVECESQRASSGAHAEAGSDAGWAHVGMASHTGPRERNEDFCAVSPLGDFWAVSDGIGGAPYGDVMSRLACNVAVSAYGDGCDAREAFDVANEAASFVSQMLAERSGATLLLAERRGAELRVVSAGDTRAFLLRAGTLEALGGTGRASAHSNALAKAVGYGAIEPDVAVASLRLGDRLLLCTDGVWETLASERVVELLSTATNAPLAAENIAWEASRAGTDNSTCVCVFVDGEEERPAGVVDAYGPNTPTTTFA